MIMHNIIRFSNFSVRRAVNTTYYVHCARKNTRSSGKGLGVICTPSFKITIPKSFSCLRVEKYGFLNRK